MGFLSPSLLPLSFNTRLPGISLPCWAAAKHNVPPVFLVPPPASLSQMLCLSLFLPVYTSSKRPLSTEKHTELCYMCEKLLWQNGLSKEMSMVTWPPNSPKFWSTELLSCQDILGCVCVCICVCIYSFNQNVWYNTYVRNIKPWSFTQGMSG